MSRNVAQVIDKAAIDAAMTEHQRELNAANRDALDTFVSSLAHGVAPAGQDGDVTDEDGKLFLSNDDLFERFCAWTSSEGASSLGKQHLLTRLGQKYKDDPSVEKCRPWVPAAGKEVRGWKFHLEALREAEDEPDEPEERETFNDDDYFDLARSFLAP